MKILMVSEDVPYPSMGGLAKHALALCRALVAAGHQVDFLGNALYSASVCGTELEFGGQFFGELSGDKVGWKETSLGMYLPPRRTWLAKKFARTVLAHAGAYDVVHYHGHVPNVAAFIPAEVPFLQTRHDQGADCLIHTRFRDGEICRRTDPDDCAVCINKSPSGFQRWVSGLAVERYRREVLTGMDRHQTIFVSRCMQQNLERTAGPGSRGQVVNNFVDIDFVKKALGEHTKTAVSVPAGVEQSTVPVKVLIPGKIYPPKGIGKLLGSLGSSLPAHIKLLVAGDGPDEAALRERFEGPNIEFLGWQTLEEVIRWAGAVDAVVVPSIWEEPCATTVLEGLCVGARVLALAQGGTPELVRYEQYPGQLQLYSSMADLAVGLGKLEKKGTEVGISALADVNARLPEILSVYETAIVSARKVG